MNAIEHQVKNANRMLYDTVGAGYEDLDGRRSVDLQHYVEDRLKTVSERIETEALLDLGCGSGFIGRAAQRYFTHSYSLDISFGILTGMVDDAGNKINADVDAIPMADNRLDCVVTFAVLHHCYRFEKMISEIYRVLKHGGVYYADHDMDICFFNRFKLLLYGYRRFNSTGRKIRAKLGGIPERLYRCSEVHQTGIPSEQIEVLLKHTGFREVQLEYHWYGLSCLTDKLFGKKPYKRGLGPLARFVALK